ncbi:MAG TPA: MarR family transcriptional regulator [Terriglobales bacterium]|nr:MarR family transcriptional regulator [Terriglobales bacterium]
MAKLSTHEYAALAEFRHQLERFLQRRRRAARDAGLQPKQYQLMLAVKGAPKRNAPTVGQLAERLQIQNHSVVELVDRLEKRNYIERHRDQADRRVVHLVLTSAGEAVLRKLVAASLTELKAEAPDLLRSLTRILRKG